MGNKTDITGYSDSELSLLVMNDEGLYNAARRLHFRGSVEVFASEFFIYTDEQFEELITDMIEDECFALEADD